LPVSAFAARGWTRPGNLLSVNPRLRAVARSAVSAVNTPVAKARCGRALRKAPRPLNLEIGGLQPRAGWVVTNVNAVTRNYMDATARWPLEDGSVRYVYADNVIEHLPLDAGRSLFAEAYRCLQPGGVMRLVTPDLRAHIELYLSGAAALDSPAARHYSGAGLVVEHPVDLVRVPIGSFGHHLGYLYDFDVFNLELKRAGFHSITRCELGRSERPELDGLDQGREGGTQIAVEAVR
jgi:hypothetical protein